jgi:hypothetical protein
MRKKNAAEDRDAACTDQRKRSDMIRPAVQNSKLQVSIEVEGCGKGPDRPASSKIRKPRIHLIVTPDCLHR